MTGTRRRESRVTPAPIRPRRFDRACATTVHGLPTSATHSQGVHTALRGRFSNGKFAARITRADLCAVFAGDLLAKAEAVARLCHRTGRSRSAGTTH